MGLSEKYRTKSFTELFNIERKNLSREEKEWYEENWDMEFSDKSENRFDSLGAANPIGVVIIYGVANLAINLLGFPIAPPFFDMMPLIDVTFTFLSKAIFYTGFGLTVASGTVLIVKVAKVVGTKVISMIKKTESQ